MVTNRLLSREEWIPLTSAEVRAIVGEDVRNGNFLAFFRRYFGEETADAICICHNYDSYELYRQWWILENTPLGKALK